MWVEFVVGSRLALGDFLQVLQFFPFKKTNISKFQLNRIGDQQENSLIKVASFLNIEIYLISIIILTNYMIYYHFNYFITLTEDCRYHDMEKDHC